MPHSERRRWWALGALALSVLVVGLDLTVLNLALPTLGTQLHASTSDLQWFIDAYSLVLAAALLPAGLLGDRLGRKKTLVPALILFGVASLACAYSRSSGELVAARAVLGLGAAVILPLAIAVIPVLFTPQERQKAIAVVMGAVFLGYPLGPILGGWLLDNFWWGSVFLINVPVIAIALVAVALLMPESRSERRPRLDVAGVAISSLGLTGLVYGVIKAGENGWTDVTALATMAVGAAVLAAFVLWERRVSRRPGGQPLVQLTLFQSAGFTWGTILSTLVSFALFGILFAMPLYFRDVRGLDSLGAGIRLLPMIGGMVVGMVAGTKLQTPPKAPQAEPGPPAAPAAAPAPRVGAKALVTVGFAVMAAGLAAGAFTSVRSGTGFGVAWFAVAGAGLGLAMPAAMNAALGALTAERSGAGSALITALRQVGAALGAAILGTVLSSAYQARVSLAGLPTAAAGAVRSGVTGGVDVARSLHSAPLLGSVDTAFVHGLDVMLWCCAGIAVAAAALALAFMPARRPDTPAEPDEPLATLEAGLAGAPATARNPARAE
ncbi:MAG TPA: MFS transporter [Streptosporangiaceae bacterium]|nr:MFS transporter [Streptosporangiaceae bacterium]